METGRCCTVKTRTRKQGEWSGGSRTGQPGRQTAVMVVIQLVDFVWLVFKTKR